jgi:succinate dehydrogenase/fumarate reductase cytochrome b subunit
MRLFGLFMLIFIMWIMIMTVSYFLVFIIGPLHINAFYNTTDRLISSIIKASLAIGLVIVLILLLGLLKTKYLQKALLKN